MSYFQQCFVFVFSLGLLASDGLAREQIRIVGSSTVFPFASTVAEKFGRKTNYKTPVVESTGSGGGMKLFCSGSSDGTPDITNASRRIKSSEYKNCTARGIDILEVKIGFDGIVLASSKAAQQMHLTRKQIFLALAAWVPNKNGKLVKNPNKKWSDIDRALPPIKIRVLGPPPSSGTRDAFVEIAMEAGAKKFPSLKALSKTNKKKFQGVAHAIREDGAFVEAGENDNLIVQKLIADPKAFGIFGFSFLDNNRSRIQGAVIEGARATFDEISSGVYPISRSLYFYVKIDNLFTVTGLDAFVQEFTHKHTWGDRGYLTQKGLIPLPKAERRKVARLVRAKTKLEF